MTNALFVFEENRLREEILKRGAKRVLLQLPEGLKPEGPRLAAVIEGAGAVAVISGDPCYGACDLPLFETETVGADLIIHYGHAQRTTKAKPSAPIIYMEARANVDIKTIVTMAVDQLRPWSRIGLATTVQHIHVLGDVKEILEKAGKTVYIGDAGTAKYAGLVLGCDYSNAKSVSNEVEAFLFLGGGRFHALGLALATMKPTVVADPFEERAYSIEAEAHKIVKRRWAAVSEAGKAENFGVIVGLKLGQSNIGAALEIKKALEKTGKKAFLLAIREVTPLALQQFPAVEAFVNTACPRIALDEPSSFAKPVLTVNEAYVMLGKIRWEDLLNGGII